MTSDERKNIESMFLAQLPTALGVNELRTGRGVLRDANGRKIAKRWVTGVWAVVVEPSRSPWLGIAAIHADDDRVLAVLLLEPGKAQARQVGPITLQATQDIVLGAINNLQLIEPDKCLSLDGTGYVWTLWSGAMRATFSVSNPYTPCQKQLEDRLMGFVRLVVDVAGEDAGDPIISGWLAKAYGPKTESTYGSKTQSPKAYGAKTQPGQVDAERPPNNGG